MAGRRDWHAVEPAIFGTLLEQALSEEERSKLGAHYTPRAYVERLVVPTVIEPLREDWEVVQSDAIGKLLDGDDKAAREVVRRFHDKLCNTRVLYPACGTGNFLYVSMELLKRLEGEVLDFLKELGETTEPLATVDPHQFLGIELNPRAVPITELVLWIGYIQWWFRTRERQVIVEPILRDFGTVKVGDAVLAYDRQELLKDKSGRPITRQDPRALKLHPITGEPIPDPDAKLPIYRYVNPRQAKWPEADFIVGNPPFIGGKDMRAELGDEYAEALWASRGKKRDSIDFVMYWWDHAGNLLTHKGSKLRRFGFITTNSITQKFSRRILEKYMKGATPLSLVFAIPDHPWQKAPKKAAVRIAMTVAESGEHIGRLAEVIDEKDLETDQPKVSLSVREGRVLADLTIGIDVTQARPLKANAELASRGVALHGSGFIVTHSQAKSLGFGKQGGLEKLILPYRNGRDLAGRSRDVMVIDLFPLSEEQVGKRYPETYQWVLQKVKPQRDVNREPSRREHWWWFGRTHEEYRSFVSDLDRYIVTIETATHRWFTFIDGAVRADNKLVAIGSDDPFVLGVLSSRIHCVWAVSAGGWLGVGNDPVYVKSRCFDPFPFPLASDAHKARIGSLSEELDSLRKRVLSQHDFLTITKLYNVREKIKRGEGLSDGDKAIHEAGCVGVINELHDKIDAAVTEAYGWPVNLSVEAILDGIVKLNEQRVQEERQGVVYWLRPKYQVPRLATRIAAEEQQIEADLEAPKVAIPALPKDDAELVTMLRGTLKTIGRPVEAKTIATKFREGMRGVKRVERGLRLLAAAGVLRHTPPGWFLPAERATP